MKIPVWKLSCSVMCCSPWKSTQNMVLLIILDMLSLDVHICTCRGSKITVKFTSEPPPLKARRGTSFRDTTLSIWSLLSATAPRGQANLSALLLPLSPPAFEEQKPVANICTYLYRKKGLGLWINWAYSSDLLLHDLTRPTKRCYLISVLCAQSCRIVHVPSGGCTFYAEESSLQSDYDYLV